MNSTHEDIIFAISSAGEPVPFQLSMGCRHGLIAGATGTGKTVSLQCLAEHFSRAGCAVFMADAKGDLAGLAKPGELSPKLAQRLQRMGAQAPAFSGCPCVLWDVNGERGHPVRTTVSEFGPRLLGRVLRLNEIQTGVLQIAFRVADDQGLLLLDVKDLRAVLGLVGDERERVCAQYGQVSLASLGAVQRALLEAETSGLERFFGEPALDIKHVQLADFSGRGVVSILDARDLINSPRLYSALLIWMIAELFETLPEVGDLQKPKLVFFFDEAHLLFADADAAFKESIEKLVRLIRSKGVGIYFVTQNPLDLPDEILSQLGNRVQHALRAFTQADRKAVRAVAKNFRAAPGFDAESAITELEVGEALISFLDAQGTPNAVQRCLVLPPASRIGPLTSDERKEILSRSPLGATYQAALDRESAYEVLRKRADNRVEQTAQSAKAPARQREGVSEAFFKSVVRAAGSQIGRQILRGIFGTLSRSGR